MTIADRLKKLRDKGGPNEISQEKLGIEMGIYKTPAAGQKRITRIEAGAEPLASEVIALAKYFKITIYELLGIDEPSTSTITQNIPTHHLTKETLIIRVPQLKSGKGGGEVEIPMKVIEAFAGNDVVLQDAIMDVIDEVWIHRRRAARTKAIASGNEEALKLPGQIADETGAEERAQGDLDKNDKVESGR